MIRTYNKQTVVVEQGVAKYLAEIFCNSADTKPTDGLVNGSKLTEVDTGKTYLFDEANMEWVEYSAGGGGGTGGGDESVVICTSAITPDSQEVVVTTSPVNLETASTIAFNLPQLGQYHRAIILKIVDDGYTDVETENSLYYYDPTQGEFVAYAVGDRVRMYLINVVDFSTYPSFTTYSISYDIDRQVTICEAQAPD